MDEREGEGRKVERKLGEEDMEVETVKKVMKREERRMEKEREVSFEMEG